MDIGVPGTKESRSADAANIAERGTPPKKAQPGARAQEQPEMTGQPEVTQGGRMMRQMTLGEWTEGTQESEETPSVESSGDARETEE